MAKRTRQDIINIIGASYLTTNLENGEYNYKKAFEDKGLEFKSINYGKKSNAKDLDIRCLKDGVAVLVETKKNYKKDKTSIYQLDAYVQYEKELNPEHKIIAILANTDNEDMLMWVNYISEETKDIKHSSFLKMDEYVDIFTPKINDKEKVIQNTYSLNEELDKAGIKESIRSQFVGTCLLALKYGLDYKTPSLSTQQIIQGIRGKLEGLLENSLNKAEKITLLDKKVLDDQAVRTMDIKVLRELLKDVDEGILPFINEKSTAGQDLLNLFFTTFNKYVNKEDKNQAFTPDHICDFMTKLTQVNHKSRVLDPCCGSGSFLVRAMTQELNDSDSEETADKVKKEHIYGIEFSEDVFGLATTNMLLHSDGNSNVVRDSCFNREDWIMNVAKPTVILMNPPYNGQKSVLPKEYTETWNKDTTRDPSKGFYFVNYIADIVNKIGGNDERITKMAVLLPVSCAIGTSSEITNFKRKMLKDNTLDAVFSLPPEMFYPGAASVACCMLFTLGKPHFESYKETQVYNKKGNVIGFKYDVGEPHKSTYFGFCRDDGFKKKKNLGRIEQIDKKTNTSIWQRIEKEWLELFRENKVVKGKSAIKKVSYDDEWLAEAYMETDYSTLTQDDFQKTINTYLSYLVKEGKVHEN